VELAAAETRELTVERPADELVGEAVAIRRVRNLLQEIGAERSPQAFGREAEMSLSISSQPARSPRAQASAAGSSQNFSLPSPFRT
jgi:hypothetical protein